MTFTKPPLTIIAAGALGMMMPGVALAQRGGTQSQRAENMRATTALAGRIASTEARIKEAQATRKIIPARATALQRQIAVYRQSMARFSKQQGFVSAAELASYNRALGTIDTELDRLGVAPSHGKHMLQTAMPHAAAAQEDAAFYHCENKPVSVQIASLPLRAAIAKFTQATRCPVSIETQQIGGEDGRELRTVSVRGRMEPSEALSRMLSQSHLHYEVIKGGFSINDEG